MIPLNVLLSLTSLASPVQQHVLQSETPKMVNTSSSERTQARRMKYELAVQPMLQPMGSYVGRLQEKWQFPSDHLPIGMTLKDDIHISSWNVLNSKHMHWVTEKDSQGLGRSMIAKEHVFIDDTTLTVRDQHVAQLVLGMIHHPTHPRALLTLQECSPAFLAELKRLLPANFAVIAHDDNAVVVDLNRFEILDQKEMIGKFSEIPENSFQEIILRSLSDGEVYRVLNAHLPGNPIGPARNEFAAYLNQLDDSMKIIVGGDMNFNELGMSTALGASTKLELYAPYSTNISTNQAPEPFRSKSIDHFFVSKGVTVKMLDVEEVMLGLTPTYHLLNPIKED